MPIKSIFKRGAFLALVLVAGGIILWGWTLVLHASADDSKEGRTETFLIQPVPYLVKDINPSSLDSNPTFLVDVNNTLFFAADDGINGKELWKSDGTITGTILVKDISINGSSSPRRTANLNGKLIFFANDGLSGDELWLSDGTAAGTHLVKDICAGPNSSNMPGTDPIVIVNGWAYFSATDCSYGGLELWKSDGTEVKTVMVKDINPAGDAWPSNLTAINGILYFDATQNFPPNFDLWRSDGTEAGTYILIKNPSQANGSGPVEVSGSLYLAAHADAYGIELWKSDGTVTGTVRVSDICPNACSSNLRELTPLDEKIYFTADDGIHGAELWASDGTPTGTEIVKDIVPGSDPSWINYITPVAHKLYFWANDGVHGIEPWKSDGTLTGTVMVKDIWPGIEPQLSFGSRFFMDWDGRVYFTADDGAHGKELWESDGSEANTMLVTDIRPGPDSSVIDTLKISNNRLYFNANDGLAGQELWAADPPPSPKTVYLPFVKR
jgi:ELWxxDGT repeat protein